MLSCLFSGKKLARGISRATDNVNLVSKARSEFALEFRENALCNVNQYFIETPIYTFTLPDLTIYPGKSHDLNTICAGMPDLFHGRNNKSLRTIL